MEDLKSFVIDSTNDDGEVDYQVDANGDAVTNEAGEKQAVTEEVYYKSDVEKRQTELQETIDKLTADGKLKDENFAKMRGSDDKKDGAASAPDVKPEAAPVDVDAAVAKALAKQSVGNKVDTALGAKFGADEAKIKAAKVVFDKLYSDGDDLGQVIAQSMNAVMPGSQNANYSGGTVGGGVSLDGGKMKGDSSPGISAIEAQLNKLNNRNGMVTNKDNK